MSNVRFLFTFSFTFLYELMLPFRIPTTIFIYIPFTSNVYKSSIYDQDKMRVSSIHSDGTRADRDRFRLFRKEKNAGIVWGRRVERKLQKPCSQ